MSESPTDISGFVLGRQIGSGKYSEVFLMFEDSNKNSTNAQAVKLLRQIGTRDEDLTEARWKYEVEIHQKLKEGDVPHVLEGKGGIIDFSKDSQGKHKTYAIIFPLVFRPIQGDKLLTLPRAARLSVLKSIKETYKTAHDNKIYHLNLDPSNVLVDRWSLTERHVYTFVIGWGLGSYADALRGELGGRVQWRPPHALKHSTGQDQTGGEGERDDMLAVGDCWRFGCFAYWLMHNGDDIFFGREMRYESPERTLAKINTKRKEGHKTEDKYYWNFFEEYWSNEEQKKESVSNKRPTDESVRKLLKEIEAEQAKRSKSVMKDD